MTNGENTVKDIGKLEAKLDLVLEQQVEIHKRIFGNGREGMLERQAKTEQLMEQILDNQEKTLEIARGNSIDIGDIKDTMTEHVNNPLFHLTAESIKKLTSSTIKEAVWNKKTILAVAALITIVSLSVHILIPDEFGTKELFDLLLKIVGL